MKNIIQNTPSKNLLIKVLVQYYARKSLEKYYSWNTLHDLESIILTICLSSVNSSKEQNCVSLK